MIKLYKENANLIRLNDISNKSEDCDFFIDESDQFFYKCCKATNLFDDYHRAFQEEYEAMNEVSNQYPHITYFPNYIDYGTLDGAPCICMKYIKSITLEEFLHEYAKKYNISSGPSTRLLESDQRKKILSQLYKAIQILYKCNIVNFDINPANIFIMNKDFDIKLMDFTFFYDLNKTDKYNQIHTYKRNDSRLKKTHPLSLRIANAFLFFYIQSFYPCKEVYLTHSTDLSELYNFFSHCISDECAQLIRTLFFDKSDITSTEWTQYENPPDNNLLFRMETYYNELTHFIP